MTTETFQELRSFVEFALTIPSQNLHIDFDAVAFDKPFSLTLMTNKLDNDGNTYQEPTVNLRISIELVEFWNNETMNGGKYPINVPHMGLFDALLAKVDAVNEHNAVVFLKEMSHLR